MASSRFESDFIFGIHEPGGEGHMLAAGKPGWIVFTEAIGHDPNNQSGKDFRPYSNQGLGVICRLNNGYHPDGTIPHSSQYANFARRCANFVAASRGCKIWIIGNEMNYAIERPQVTRAAQPAATAAPSQGGLVTMLTALMDLVQALLGRKRPPAEPAAAPTPPTPDPEDPLFHGAPERFNALGRGPAGEGPQAAATPQAAPSQVGEVITPQLYAQCYRLCRQAIRQVPGHEDDQVLVGAVAPWNNQTSYPGNEIGDWVRYFQDILNLLGPDGCDGFTLHTYTHQADPNLIHSDAKMNPPFQNRHYEFRAYRDFMAAVPPSMRHLPVYITETDQDVPWANVNTGWVQRAYAEIHWWNSQPGNQPIRALVLYRWPKIDKWYIEGKQGVIDDFRAALQHDYRWPKAATTSPQGPFKAGDVARTTTVLNLRRTPGYLNQPADDIIAEIPTGTRVTILDGQSRQADGLTWWRVRAPLADGRTTDGWLAQFGPTGTTFLEPAGAEEPPTPPPPGEASFKVGDLVLTRDVVRMRRSPGYRNKPEADIVADVPLNTVLTVVAGPRQADGLIWWQLRGKVAGVQREGWMAELDPTGRRLLDKTTAPPPISGKFQVGDPVETVNYVRLRRSPGFLNKPPDDVLADIWPGTAARILAGPQAADELIWWQVETTDSQGRRVQGWMAESAPGDIPLLVSRRPSADQAFTPGDLVVVVGSAGARVRRSPGYQNKPADDVLGDFASRATVYILDGPRTADGLTWWRGGGIGSNGREVVGWVAQQAPGDGSTIPLLGRAPRLPGTEIPDKATGRYLGAPFQGQFGIGQLWGENPDFYARFTYDGVPLKGHNGIDFLTPTGTPITAVDGGQVALVGFEAGGFGHFVLLAHSWGQSIYAHLDRVAVQQGQQVARGDVLGRSGNTGASTGPHLHFAIRINPYSRTDGWGGFSDPLPYLTPEAVILPGYIQALPAPQAMVAPEGAVAAPPAEGILLPRLAPSPLAPETPGTPRP
ncbi:MAG: hypothetical protein KatS3mg050_1865 [Litorilinea sp.]|nr:MAG: hypothetical protein KatS3mg050_1865 [Litorilinea sp.]